MIRQACTAFIDILQVAFFFPPPLLFMLLLFLFAEHRRLTDVCA